MDRERLSTIRLRFHALLHRRRLDRDLEEELAFHLATRAERSDPLAARRSFGNPTLVKETMRDMWTFNWLDMLGKDLRYAARSLRKSPGFAAVAVLTLALGIGANTAIFSVVNAVLLRALPYPQPERLVELWGNVKRARVERRGTSFADYLDWKRQSQSFEGMALFINATQTLTGTDEPERLPAEFVGHGYFEMLGIEPQLGRVFRAEEDQVPQRDAVAVLSDGLWKRRFGGDRAIVGRPIQLDGRMYTVIGIAPARFRGVYDNSDLWLPLMMAVQPRDLANRGSRGPSVLARLKPGVALAQAQSEMDAVTKGLERQYPESNDGRGVEISPLEQEIFGNLRRPLVVLLVAVGFVLLIACANVANLMLARSEARQREIAVRIALGAGRGRMIHQLLTESLVLALFGAGAGLLVARWGVKALVAASPISFPGYIQPGIDWTVAAFTGVVSCLAGVVMGLAPAVQVRTSNLFEAFKQASSHAADSRKGQRFRNALVVAEVAFAMLLLVGAGLLIRSVQQLAAIQPGYDASHVLTLRVGMPRLAAGSDAQAAVTAREMAEKVARIPSVESVALGSDVPLGGSSAIFFTAEGQPPVTAQNMPRAYIHRVGANFFQTLRIRLLAGRTFTDEEMKGATAAVVSEALVKRFWPGQDPIGKRLKAGPPESTNPWMTIVGVVNDMKYRGLPENPTADPDLFIPFAQQARQFALLLRTPLPPESLTTSVRRAVREADPGAVIYSVSSMDELMSRQTASSRFTGWLMGIFAASALLLAMIGIYGVMSYAVTRRTQEIGIRVALGAARGDVLRMVVRRGMTLIGVGLALGIAGALALSRLLDTLLFGVTARDTLSFAAAAVMLGLVALAACLIPATRAARIHPAIALRNE
jgi:predicted permease